MKKKIFFLLGFLMVFESGFLFGMQNEVFSCEWVQSSLTSVPEPVQNSLRWLFSQEWIQKCCLKKKDDLV